jgi:hypothetical protein
MNNCRLLDSIWRSVLTVMNSSLRDLGSCLVSFSRQPPKCVSSAG